MFDVCEKMREVVPVAAAEGVEEAVRAVLAGHCESAFVDQLAVDAIPRT